jgi:pentatricopeptide repeat protein
MEIPTIAEIWETVGSEFLIFVMTFFVAAIIQVVSKKEVRTVVNSKQCVDVEADTAVPDVRGGRSVDFNIVKPEYAGKRQLGSGVSEKLLEDIMASLRNGTPHFLHIFQLYEELRDGYDCVRDLCRRCRVQPLDFFGLLVHGAVRSGTYEVVTVVLDDMDKAGVVRTVGFFEGLMKVLACQKNFRVALTVYDRMEADGLQPSVVTCSCVVRFAAEVQEFDRAISCFNRLASMTTPSIRAYMTILRVHARKSDWKSSRDVVRHMLDRRAELDSLVLNVAFATGIAADEVSDVHCMIEEVEGLCPGVLDVVSYNTLVKGYAQRSDAKSAVALLNHMQQHGPLPNVITFNTAMDATVRGGCVGSRAPDAWELFQLLRLRGLEADKFTCSILVKGLTKEPTADRVSICLGLVASVDGQLEGKLRRSLYMSLLEAAYSLQDRSVANKVSAQMARFGLGRAR